MPLLLRIAAVLVLAAPVWSEARAASFSINDAISQAVLTNPGVGEASANRRATEAELRQTQGTLLPQVRLESRLGPEKFEQQITPPPFDNGKWLPGRAMSVAIRQLLFDGFASIHDIWRQSARVNAASYRVRERSELIALDAAEAYMDVVRYRRLVATCASERREPRRAVLERAIAIFGRSRRRRRLAAGARTRGSGESNPRRFPA